MASVTSWTRLEPHPRDPDTPRLDGALEARVHDPLWLLARQFQLGALNAETGAATPVWVRLQAESGRLTRFLPRAPDGSPGVPYDSASLPLEELVEAEPLPAAAQRRRVRLAPVAGLEFLRFLAEAGLSRYRSGYLDRYPFAAPTGQLDPATLRFLEVVGGRVPDGVALHDDLVAMAGLPPEPRIDARDVPAVTVVAVRFLAWYAAVAGRVPPGEPAWVRDRMEYAFAVSSRLSDRERVLIASEYTEGTLDWYSFDLDPDAALGASGVDPGGEPAMIVHAAPPTPLSYPGMPAPRYWEFEDAAVDFGETAEGLAGENLATLLLIEFAIAYGNDFYVVPVDLTVGSVCRIRSLVVTDCFGRRTLVRPAADRDDRESRFRLFELTVPAGATRESLLVLPPTLGPSLESGPIEDVTFFRDEVANLVWAVEQVAAGDDGQPRDRTEAYHERRRRDELAEAAAAPEVPTTGADANLRYRLRTSLPDHWFPLLAAPGPDGSIRLGLTTVPLSDGSPGPPPWGRVLGELAGVGVPEEEVPRAGAQVTRSWQYARWIDGRQRLWVGRRKRVGRGEGGSALRFDVAETQPDR
jgi:hypothetical protein